jgi:hypothetical protein
MCKFGGGQKMEFSVRSAYHMQKDKEMVQTAGGSRCAHKSSIWTNI